MTVHPGRNSLVTRVRSLRCTISARRNGSRPPARRWPTMRG